MSPNDFFVGLTPACKVCIIGALDRRCSLMIDIAKPRRALTDEPLTTMESSASASVKLTIVIVGLTITSSWGNGHASAYRSLVKGLVQRGHRVIFLECENPRYSEAHDLAQPPFFDLAFYRDVDGLRRDWTRTVTEADLVIIGSFVAEGVTVAQWAMDAAVGLVAFYDLDTPVTLAKLDRGDTWYLQPDLIPRYDIYLSFSAGPILDRLEHEFRSPMARCLYCTADADLYYPEAIEPTIDLGFLGSYSPDRQSALERMLMEPARRWQDGRFLVAGTHFPDDTCWPHNVRHVKHVPPSDHRGFYAAQRFTLNVTRPDMIMAGWSPSVRVFEAAACGIPIVSDRWTGVDQLFEPGREILVLDTTQEVLECLAVTPETERRAIGDAARARFLRQHTARHRAMELERYVAEARDAKSCRQGVR